MQPGPDFNPYAAPSEQVDREVAPGLRTVAEPLASLGHRFLAFAVDYLFMVGAFLPGTLLFSADPQSELALAVMAITCLPFLVSQTWLISSTGQSIGKKLLKTKIVTMTGEPPGFVRGVLLRSWLPAALSALPLLGGVVALTDALFVLRHDRHTMHDHIAGTTVIQVP